MDLQVLFLLSCILQGMLLLSSIEAAIIELENKLPIDDLLKESELLTLTDPKNNLLDAELGLFQDKINKSAPLVSRPPRKTRQFDLSIPGNLKKAVKKMEEYFTFHGDNNCALFDPPMPMFLVPGRRISEAKCLEYIWDVKVEEETTRRMQLCMKEAPDFSGVVDGRPAAPAEFPHMGAIGWQDVSGGWLFLCGGTLISHRFVLTAAHCYRAPESEKRVANSKPQIVRLGVTNIKDLDRIPVDAKIEEFIRNRRYNDTMKYFDIALILLKQTIKFDNNIRPACLWNSIRLYTKVGIVTGWGVTEKDPTTTKTSDTLQVAKVDFVSSAKCNVMLQNKMKYASWWGVPNHQVCAINLNATGDTCRGDSGGPIQKVLKTRTKNRIYSVIGITASGFSSACGGKMFPAVYTRIASFINWIEKLVWI